MDDFILNINYDRVLNDVFDNRTPEFVPGQSSVMNAGRQGGTVLTNTINAEFEKTQHFSEILLLGASPGHKASVVWDAINEGREGDVIDPDNSLKFMEAVQLKEFLLSGRLMNDADSSTTITDNYAREKLEASLIGIAEYTREQLPEISDSELNAVLQKMLTEAIIRNPETGHQVIGSIEFFIEESIIEYIDISIGMGANTTPPPDDSADDGDDAEGGPSEDTDDDKDSGKGGKTSSGLGQSKDDKSTGDVGSKDGTPSTKVTGSKKTAGGDTHVQDSPTVRGHGTQAPVILDLDGDGIEIAFGEEIFFDTDGDGFAEKTSWAAADDGFLVLDLNADGTRGAGDGAIDQSKELALSLWGEDGDTDLQALARFDLVENGGNGDGVLDASDAIWSELKVWQDLDQDGQTEGDGSVFDRISSVHHFYGSHGQSSQLISVNEHD